MSENLVQITAPFQIERCNPTDVNAEEAQLQLTLAIHKLKVNVQSLASESRIIRRMTDKAKGPKRRTKHRSGQPQPTTVLRRPRSSWPAPEQRMRAQVVHELSLHRVTHLREEARYAQLVLAYLRGRTYLQVERNARSKPSITKLQDKLKRFYRFNYRDLTAETYEVLRAWVGLPR